MEYCQFEQFNASCAASNQVVLMEHAQYGRLQVGRCMSRDYGYLGCSVSVLDLFDQACSGQRWCQFSVPTLREFVQPCPKDLTSYLEASYRCITVLKISHMRCNETIHVNSSTSSSVTSPVYISTSSSSSSLTATATASAPHSWGRNLVPPSSLWPPPPLGLLPTSTASVLSNCQLQIKARPGQQLNFTLYSVSQSSPEDYEQARQALQAGPPGVLDSASHRSCPIIMTLFLLNGSQVYSSRLCQERLREFHLYTTNDSSILIHFSGAEPEEPTLVLAYFLKIEAVGCPDLAPPTGSWAERIDERLVVRCNTTHDTWYLTCMGQTWIGNVGNCTQAALPVNGPELMTKRSALPVGLFMAIVIGVILGVIFGVAMLVVVSVYRYRRRRRLQHCVQKTTSLLRSDDVTRFDNDRNDEAVNHSGCSTDNQHHVTGDIANVPMTSLIYSRVCPVHAVPLYRPQYSPVTRVPHPFAPPLPPVYDVRTHSTSLCEPSSFDRPPKKFPDDPENHLTVEGHEWVHTHPYGPRASESRSDSRDCETYEATRSRQDFPSELERLFPMPKVSSDIVDCASEEQPGEFTECPNLLEDNELQSS